MILRKTKLAVAVGTAIVAMAGALVAPQAAAHSRSKDRVAQADDAKIRALEAQMAQMRQMMGQMQSELAAARTADPKVQELDEWMQSVKSAPVKADHHDNTIFFRGGYARNDGNRNGVSIQSDVAVSDLTGTTPGGQADKDAWYFGAGFDFGLTDDAWGLMDDTQVLAELMFEYKKFGETRGNGLTAENGLGGTPRTVTVNQFTLTASPKIKFMKDSAFRPWIIPVGFAMHVVSPPSESITVLNPGVMFGAGADYRIWKDIFLGADARYHLTASDADGVDTDGFTAGGYIGIGF